MLWDDLRYVLETARCRSVSRASERLGVKHSTVLRRIRAFEQDIGTELFERDKQGYRLNIQGQEVIGDIEQLEQAVLSFGAKTARPCFCAGRFPESLAEK